MSFLAKLSRGTGSKDHRRREYQTLVALQKTDWRCYWCSRPLMTKEILGDDLLYWCREQEVFAVATLEHLVPSCLGGTRQMHNLVAACNSCNSGRKTNPMNVAGTNQALMFYDGRYYMKGDRELGEPRWVLVEGLTKNDLKALFQFIEIMGEEA